jgi:hypothetical protein
MISPGIPDDFARLIGASTPRLAENFFAGFSSSSARTNLSSFIGSSRALQVEVLQLHFSRLA